MSTSEKIILLYPVSKHPGRGVWLRDMVEKWVDAIWAIAERDLANRD
jgi:predicted RNA-binding protein YlxR (DUF448 family)